MADAVEDEQLVQNRGSREAENADQQEHTERLADRGDAIQVQEAEHHVETNQHHLFFKPVQMSRITCSVVRINEQMQRPNQQEAEQGENVERSQFQCPNFNRLRDDNQRHNQIKKVLNERHMVDCCRCAKMVSDQISDEADVAGANQ